jgi:hypothetical protein
VAEATGGGIVRHRGEGETTSVFGDTYAIKASGEETGGTLAVIEADLAPHTGGRAASDAGAPGLTTPSRAKRHSARARIKAAGNIRRTPSP